MDYELINEVNSLGDNVLKEIKARLKKSNGQLLCLTSMPNMRNFLQANGINGTTLIDHITGRTYDPKSYRYFNEINVPSMDYVQMQKDGSLFVDDQGIFIAREYMFPNTRRAAQDIRYLNPDGSYDYIEEYASDGKVYSHLYYANGKLEEIEFVNMQGQPVIRYFYYEGNLNFITVEDPEKHEVISRYNNLLDFYVDQLNKMMTKKDTVNINFLGIELTALQNTKSHNQFYLSEDPIDNDGEVRGNLASILKDTIPYINTVKMNKTAYKKLRHATVPLKKAEIV
ncbi:hypothetical protein OZX69_03715 [Lactobacillus sp. ESL0731]|uniref:hypothetical protein n=1 Tax=unclassified Lactobacillus TaxID=2620435 RepID=UPI0023F832CD|nr:MULTISPECIES: hypothetical protein [unclassified Lactobacillus]WEV51817.1 hypothetical protein OZX63_03715 [Lactobacillus sp. ESL0700]WEV62946.1 hypothetical protein OZX69_03715 [Lactobacillus sp. ESL0731]